MDFRPRQTIFTLKSKKIVKSFARWSAMVFRTGWLGPKNLKKLMKMWSERWSAMYFGPANDVNLKVSRKFQTRNLFNKFEIAK